MEIHQIQEMTIFRLGIAGLDWYRGSELPIHPLGWQNFPKFSSFFFLSLMLFPFLPFSIHTPLCLSNELVFSLALSLPPSEKQASYSVSGPAFLCDQLASTLPSEQGE
jgi:hypothetical protein